MKIDSYVKDMVVRRLIYSNIQNVQGIWTARQLTMTDLRRYTRTALTLNKIEYDVPIPETRLTLQALRTP